MQQKSLMKKSVIKLSLIPNYLFYSCSIGVADIENSSVDILCIFRSVSSLQPVMHGLNVAPNPPFLKTFLFRLTSLILQTYWTFELK